MEVRERDLRNHLCTRKTEEGEKSRRVISEAWKTRGNAPEEKRGKNKVRGGKK